MAQVTTMTASPRFVSSQFHFLRVLFVAIGVLAGGVICRAGAVAESSAQHATLVIFADHGMKDGLWTALVEELHRSQAKEAVTVPLLAGDFDVLRGDKTVPELGSGTVVSVFLMGDCSLIPGPRRYVDGALGWVREVKGEIRPFVHVNCEEIVEMLGPIALGMNEKRRNTVMAEAIARVVVHEWIHIATQKAGHAKQGVMQSQFVLWDLLADDEQMNPQPEARHCKKGSCGL